MLAMIRPLISMDAVVECQSGHTYAERPKAFYWEGVRFEIQRIAAQWRAPDGRHFKVITTQGRAFQLVYDQNKDVWKIDN
jgi:hypothetical protein